MKTKTNSSNLFVAATILGFYSFTAKATTITAVSCSKTDVQTAITNANTGDTVLVPAGTCTWNAGITINKGIYLKGAGTSSTTIKMGNGGFLNISKQPTRSVEVSDFTFTETGTSLIMKVFGAWSDEPPLIHHNVFNVTNSQVMRYETNGGVIHHNTFTGLWNDGGIQMKGPNNNVAWSTNNSLGTNDTNGKMNIYIEDNIFNGMPNGCMDMDDGSRVVVRHNTFNSGCVNSHGLDTSPIGLRHFEVYNNTFLYPDNTVNQNWFIWIRGGSGVIFNNAFDNLIGQMWGDKTEILFSIRMVNDGGVLGCANGYPAPNQIGQDYSTTNGNFTNPLTLWGNTGSFAWGINQWPNTCGLDINDYLQYGRDVVIASAPKAGYTPYCYPHPLTTGVACNTVAVVTAIQERTDNTSFGFYPNPANTSITITNASNHSQISVVDITGKQVLTTTIDSENPTINVNALTNGLYFIKLTNQDQFTLIKKLTIVK